MLNLQIDLCWTLYRQEQQTMPLTFGDDTVAGKLNKCKQEAASLELEVTEEGFRRFADHAWHLCDWIMNADDIPASAKNEVRAWKRKQPPPIPELCVCQDVINADKHLQITRYTPATDDVTSQQGWGIGRFGKGGFGFGEHQITITMQDGAVYDALQITQAVVNFWNGFFDRHSLDVSVDMSDLVRRHKLLEQDDVNND
jgi:hypothetical protein